MGQSSYTTRPNRGYPGVRENEGIREDFTLSALFVGGLTSALVFLWTSRMRKSASAEKKAEIRARKLAGRSL